MEYKIKKEVKIGVLMIIIIGFFIWGYSFLKGKNIFKPTNTYYAVYDRVGGLMESGHVIMKGYQIGYVDDIRFTGDLQHLIVSFSIDRKFTLPKGTIVKIFSYDIMGTRALELIPGPSAERHMPGDTLQADIEPDLREEISAYLLPLTSKAEDMMVSMDSVLIIFKAILDEEFRESFDRTFNNINLTVSSLQRSAHSVDTLFTKRHSRFNRILDNLESISGNIAGNNESISTILNNFASVSDSLARSELLSTVENLNDALHKVNNVMDSISQGKGSLGKLISDEELYNNLDSATKNLDLLLIDLKEHPGRYVNFSIFGKRGD